MNESITISRTPTFHTLLVFRCTTKLSERLAARAKTQGTNVSALIRSFVVAGLESAEDDCR